MLFIVNELLSNNEYFLSVHTELNTRTNMLIRRMLQLIAVFHSPQACLFSPRRLLCCVNYDLLCYA